MRIKRLFRIKIHEKLFVREVKHLLKYLIK